MSKLYLLVRRCLTVALVMAAFAGYAQQSVTGKVTAADDGSGIPGVNVLEKGTSNGTVTDSDGNFRINVGANATLVFSFVGYATQEVAVGSQSSVNVSLLSDVTALSEVVVVGYGTQDKKEITSSVTSIKSEDFNKGTVNDPVQLLQGKVAGLNITRPGGDPNAGFNIRLRGVGTIGANAEPLVVIDGVIGGSLSTVDPNDILSVDVLKDGSAAAIYGSRGGSGVILITTKSGKKGRVDVSYNGSVAVESIARTIDFMSADEYRQVQGAVNLGSSTNWLDVVTKKGSAMVHNLSLSGGSEKTTYRASFNVREASGIAINSGFTQLNGRLNLTQKALKDKATFTMNVSSTTKDAEYGFTESLRYAVIANPTMPVYDNTTTSPTAGGNFGGYAQRDIFDFFNPLAIAEQNQNDGKDTRLLTSLRGDYDFSDVINGLSAAVFYSQQRESDFRGYYYSKFSKFRGAGRNGLAGRRNDQRFNELFETTVNYNKNINNANLALLGGYSYQYFLNEGFGMEGGNFLTDAFGYNNMGAALDFANGLGNVFSYANSNKLVAFFGRANLNVSETYFASVSARYEGSSRFGKNNKWGLFPAASAGVTLSNLVDIPSVNSLKLRASYGVTGNQPGSSYESLSRIGRLGNFFYEGVYVPSYGPVSNANPDLKWETKSEIDFGVDFSMLNNKLTGTIDYYTRTTKDMILPVNVPVPPNLYGTTLVNIGELKNDGFELALNYNPMKAGLIKWTVGGNFSTYNTKVVSLTSGPLSFGSGGVLYRAGMGAPGQNDFRLIRVKEGQPLGEIWGPVQVGVNPDGTPKFKDINGDGGNYCDCDDDKTVLGNGLPNFTAGLNFTVSYKNFDLSTFFRGAFGHDLVNSYRGFYENRESTTVGNYNIVNTKYYDPNITKAVFNSSHVEKASFVKLDNMQIGYNVPLKGGSTFTNFRVYVAGQNLFVITGYTGIDPEVRYTDRIDGDGGGNPGAVDALSPGIERRSTYFTTRTFTFGVNIGF
ncbi:MAG: SusC/RagA family TonB-linked outer membrane protein [Cytophagales bacterium]|nr:SusC/RagA family TonB-linked outer membrane protein [Cytophagales bacterium]